MKVNKDLLMALVEKKTSMVTLSTRTLIKAIKPKVQIGSQGRNEGKKKGSPLAFLRQNLHGDPLFGQV
jgi:hypothetical protein